MATFSVLLLTANPPGQSAEGAGAFVKIDSRECLMKSVELFLNRSNIKQIQLVIAPEHVEEAKRKYGGHLGFSGVKMLTGGPKWIDQIAAAADRIAAECTHVMLHDAARPAVAYTDLDALSVAADKHAIVALAVPCRAQLVEVDPGGNPVAIHSADEFMQLLTPQSFKKEKFVEMAKSRKEAHASEFHLLKGWPNNVRVGGAGDASLARAMISLLPKPKIKAADNPFEEAQW